MNLQDLNLPIQDHARAILEVVRSSQVSIVEGATGSGKTTLLPYLLYRGGLARSRKIACVLPTRPGAVMASEFVAEVLQDKDADIVGHQVRNSRRVSRETKIVYMTEGVLARQVRLSTHLDQYSVIILDEVHERRPNYDFLMGYLKSLLPLRPDLKVILSSATMRTAELSQFFGGVPSYSISGRMFPVDVKFCPPPRSKDPYHYIRDIAKLVRQIYTEDKSAGHSLVFLPGAAEIFFAQQLINSQAIPKIECLPFHGRLEREDRKRVFAEGGVRKIILATNIAETSVTIKGVTHVIDSGLARESRYNPTTNTRTLYVRPISQSSVVQRTGRAGRTQAGVCYRMYSEESFAARDEYPTPGICKEDLIDLVFLLLELGVKNPDQLDLPTPITREQSELAVQRLQKWGLINEDRYITPFGEKVAWLSADGVQIGRMLLLAAEAGVGVEAAEVAAFLSILKFNDREAGVSFKLGGKYDQFADPRGDPITFLRMLRAYAEHRGDARWCAYQGLDIRLLEDAFLMRDTLVEGLEALGYRCSGKPQNLDKVHRGLVRAWGGTLCVYDRHKRYRAGNIAGIKYRPTDRKQTGYPSYVVAFGLLQMENGLRMTNTITVPEDMVEQVIEVYGNPGAMTPERSSDSATLRLSGAIRIVTPFAERVAYLNLDCERSPSRSLRVVAGRSVVVEETRVPLRWLRISEAAQIQLARHNITSLGECPKSYEALYNNGLPEGVCQEVVSALSRLGYIPVNPKPQTTVATAAEEVKSQEEDAEESEAPTLEVSEEGNDLGDDWLLGGLLTQPVKALGLSTPVVLRLVGAGIKSVGELANLEPAKLSSICDRQDRLVDEVIAKLEEYGIDLENAAEKRQLQRMWEAVPETTMEQKFTEEEARKLLGDVDYDRFMRYRTATNAADRIVARNEIIAAHRRLAHKVVPMMRSALARAMDKAISEDDLKQEAIFGLMTAIAKFEPRSGYRFSTYAISWIRQAMFRMIQNQGVIRFPVHRREELSRFGSAFMSLTAKLGRDPTEEELADKMKTTIEHICFLNELRIVARTKSLDAPVIGKNGHSSKSEEGEGTFGDTISSQILTPEEEISRLRSDALMKQVLTEVLDEIHVPARHMVAFRMRHGLDGDVPKTLEQVAYCFGLTRERIRQMEEKVFEALNQPGVKERLFVATPWGQGHRENFSSDDDLAEILVIDEEAEFERRPEVEVMRAKGSAIMRELRAVLATLPVPERAIKVFKLHHGLDGGEHMPIMRVAERLGLTEELTQEVYDLVIKHLYSTEVWKRLRKVMPSLAEPRKVIEAFAPIRETGKADTMMTMFVDPQADVNAQAREILETVALRAHIDPERLLLPSRKPEVVQARWLAMVILRDHLKLTYPEIGAVLGGMDHSTVMHGYKQGKRMFGHVTWQRPNNSEVDHVLQGDAGR